MIKLCYFFCGTWIDHKADSPQKNHFFLPLCVPPADTAPILWRQRIYLKVQNIHFYPHCNTTRHLITGTKHPKMVYVESAFTYNSETIIFFFAKHSTLMRQME